MTSNTLIIQTADGIEHSFRVWVARSPTDLGRGLSGLRHLDPDSGMVLDFGATVLAAITMRGMMFPIDILFLNPAGRLQYWTTAEPGDQLRQGMSRWVIELPPGTASRLGIDSRTSFRLVTRL
jgi:uncharacterized membrane protein (UPF0127 family)